MQSDNYLRAVIGMTNDRFPFKAPLIESIYWRYNRTDESSLIKPRTTDSSRNGNASVLRLLSEIYEPNRSFSLHIDCLPWFSRAPRKPTDPVPNAPELPRRNICENPEPSVVTVNVGLNSLRKSTSQPIFEA